MTTTAEKMAPANPERAAADTEKHAPEKRKALGRGLESLLPGGPRVVAGAASGAAASAPAGSFGEALEKGTSQPGVVPEIHAQARAAGSEEVVHIKLDDIEHNPYQTRKFFDEDAMRELADSILATGVVQPVVVRPATGGRYFLILGERRCRAARMAKKATIPAIVRKVSDQQAAEMTVVENLQRQDLNCMEQAAAFAKLSQNFGLTQDQIGQRVGLSRESVSNYMRLLKLPGTVMDYLMRGVLGFSEARELLKLPDNDTIAVIAKEAVEKSMSLVQLLDRIEDFNILYYHTGAAKPPQPGRARWVDPNVRAEQAALERVLGVRVRIRDRKGKGKIVIEYASVDDYERVVGMLKGKG